MSGGLTVDVRGSYASPCACHAEANAPLDAGALIDLFDELGEAVAVGEFARLAGIAAGSELVAQALELADLMAAGPVETGSAAAIAARLSAGAARVVAPAASAWARLRANPELVSRLGSVAVRAGGVLGAYLLASKWLSPDEEAKAEHVREWRKMVGEAAAKVPPADALKILAGANPFGDAGGGLSFGGWLGLGLVVVAGLVAWRWTR